VPVELTDREDSLWQGPVGPYLDYMAKRGWHLPVRERIYLLSCQERGVDPTLGTYVCAQEGRRRAAVYGWAGTAGIMAKRWPSHVDHQALKALGLL
jgi:hypothetical protein